MLTLWRGGAEIRPNSMGNRVQTEPVIRFHDFQVNLETGEVWTGVRLKLQDQPFKVLAALLQRPGQIVTREELRQLIWPEESFGDFDHAINLAVTKLRGSLGDSADVPHLIETLPRRGYRFIAPVDNPGIKEVVEARRSSAFPRTAKWTPNFAFVKSKRLALLFSILGFLVVAAVVLWMNLRSPLSVPRVVDSIQVTKDGLPKELTLKLLSDGTRLYFQEGTISGHQPFSTFIQGGALVQVSTQGSDTARIPVPFEDPTVYDISQARSELLVGGRESKSPADERNTLWAVPLPVGSPHRLGDIAAQDASWAPNGRQLVFAHGKDLFAAKSDGSEIRKLATTDCCPSWIRFSPDGTRLRFTIFNKGTHPEEWDIMEMGADGSGPHRLPIHGCCGTWSADGQYYFYQTNRDVWVLPERRSIIRGVELGTPVQLTAGPITFGAPTPGADGKQLFVLGKQPRIELVHYESKSKQFVPFLGGISAGEPEVSPDGQWVAYTTYPDSALWRSKLDGSERLQLTFAPMNAHEPRWSPDGKQILFTDVPSKIFIVPANGGTPQQLMSSDSTIYQIGAGAWLPDGNSIVFVMVSFGTPPGGKGSEKNAIYRLNLKTQQISKISGSDDMFRARLSRDGRYLTTEPVSGNNPKVMLYNFQTERWSELAQGGGSITWSHDSKFVYLQLKQGTQPADLVRISVPGGKIDRVLDLKDVTLGGFWSDWISLLPDDSPLLMLERSTQEIYRLDLQYR